MRKQQQNQNPRPHVPARDKQIDEDQRDPNSEHGTRGGKQTVSEPQTEERVTRDDGDNDDQGELK
jgi:hypothetical protein